MLRPYDVAFGERSGLLPLDIQFQVIAADETQGMRSGGRAGCGDKAK